MNQKRKKTEIYISIVVLDVVKTNLQINSINLLSISFPFTSFKMFFIQQLLWKELVGSFDQENGVKTFLA